MKTVICQKCWPRFSKVTRRDVWYPTEDMQSSESDEHQWDIQKSLVTSDHICSMLLHWLYISKEAKQPWPHPPSVWPVLSFGSTENGQHETKVRRSLLDQLVTCLASIVVQEEGGAGAAEEMKTQMIFKKSFSAICPFCYLSASTTLFWQMNLSFIFQRPHTKACRWKQSWHSTLEKSLE